MTEKRFKADKYFEVWDNDDFLLSFDQTVDLLNQLNEENEQLKSIKKFADRNGICIFNIDEAFRRCWQDNAKLVKENEQLKASLYAEKTNTAEVVNDYSKQFKRHSAQFSFMMDLADDLGVDVATLEALDD